MYDPNSAQYNPQSMDFMSYIPRTDNYDQSGMDGSMMMPDYGGSTEYGGGQKMKYSGFGSGFLDKKGFGWLMEVQDPEDEEDARPLLEELDIDISDIFHKIKCVLLPGNIFGSTYKHQVVRDSPDFWGPLFVILVYALLSLYGQLSVVSWILTVWLFGSLFIFLLARVLGGEIGYSQCLGILGYCVIPLVIVATILPFLHSQFYPSLLVKFCGIVWATFSAGSLLCVDELVEKRPLLLYPIFLLYIYMFSLYSGV